MHYSKNWISTHPERIADKIFFIDWLEMWTIIIKNPRNHEQYLKPRAIIKNFTPLISQITNKIWVDLERTEIIMGGV